MKRLLCKINEIKKKNYNNFHIFLNFNSYQYLILFFIIFTKLNTKNIFLSFKAQNRDISLFRSSR